MFHPFLDDREVKLVGAEAAGKGVDTRLHAATITKGTVGVIHGSMTYLLQNEEGQIQRGPFHFSRIRLSGCGPEHAFLAKEGRAEYVPITDEEALGHYRIYV